MSRTRSAPVSSAPAQGAAESSTAEPAPLAGRGDLPAPLPQPAPVATSRLSGWLLLVTCLVVLAATFGAAYALTRLLG